jgi:predicted transcriptional regulator
MKATSLAAYEKSRPKFGSNRARVYQYILDKQEYGATDQELQQVLNLSGDTLRPARLSLLKENLIYDSGKTRQNANGNECIVWVVSKIEQIGLF